MVNDDYKYQEITSKIIGAAFEVHNTLKNGFQEIIYQKALEVEFGHKGLTALREVEMPVYYKGIRVGTRRVDFFVENKIVWS